MGENIMLYLCDTCILIDYLRGNQEVQKKLLYDRQYGLGMSAITYMELMVGALNKHEISIIKKAFADIQIIEFSEYISAKSRMLIEQFSKSHGLLIPDAIIAATAMINKIPLYTANIKDFHFIPDLELIPLRY